MLCYQNLNKSTEVITLQISMRLHMELSYFLTHLNLNVLQLLSAHEDWTRLNSRLR